MATTFCNVMSFDVPILQKWRGIKSESNVKFMHRLVANPGNMNTISTSKADVPIYLQSGEFYRSLSDDEDHHQQISVPSNTVKADTIIKNNADLHHLLSSLRFWGVAVVSGEMIKYCLSDQESFCFEILQEFVQDFPYVSAMISILAVNQEAKAMVAVESGILEIVRNLPENLTVTVDCCSAAARAGNLEILQCLHERGGQLNSTVLLAALEGGKGLECVQYLRAHKIYWPYDTLVYALKGGSKECFHYALQDGCTWEDDDCINIYEDQYVEALKYAIQHGCPVNSYLAAEAAAYGAIKCLQVLHKVNCPWDDKTCREASRNGFLDCLQYLHENSCPWDEYTVYWAVENNHIECVQYALQQGCPIHISSCYIAAKIGNSAVLQCLHEAGAHWDEDTCTAAAQFGNQNCLQYAHEHGASWGERTFRMALKSGQLECLEYLLESGCPIDMERYQELMTQGKVSQEAVNIVRSFHPDLL